jgi:hypothetical protein
MLRPFLSDHDLGKAKEYVVKIRSSTERYAIY